MAHHVIYVPGIGDTKTTFQELAVKTWRIYGVVPHTFAMRWADGRPFAPKFERLLAFIDSLLEKGHTVSLVGASAGATVVINAYCERVDKIHGVVCIAGKVNNAQAIGSWYRKKTPAFVESANKVQKPLAGLNAEQRSRIMSRYAMLDPIVPRRDSIIPGAQNVTVLTSGHAVTIAAQLLFVAPLWIHFLKRLPLRTQR